MKKQTKLEKCTGCFEVYKAIKEGREPKNGAKDGSIVTKPIIPAPTLSEKGVLKGCLSWLRKRRIVCDRMNVGAGVMGSSGFRTYGIKGAGDIIGLLPNGQHVEFECKRGIGGRLSVNQQERKGKIINSGGLYFVIHGVAELEYYLCKTCSKCKIEKLISDFYRHKFTKDGLHSWCKDCIKDSTSIWRQTISGCLHDKFNSIKQRCNDPNFSGYKYWGGRGIQNKFVDSREFINYIIEELKIDPRGLEIHRIDNNGHYERGNIKFLTKLDHRKL